MMKRSDWLDMVYVLAFLVIIMAIILLILHFI